MEKFDDSDEFLGESCGEHLRTGENCGELSRVEDLDLGKTRS